MNVLTLRTDKPEAEIGIFHDGSEQVYIRWEAHRILAETIHQKINEVLDQQNLSLKDINAVAIYQGPGSFTGLRIGISVANALADGLEIPIVGAESESWLEVALEKLNNGKNEQIVQPFYGALPNITAPKK